MRKADMHCTFCDLIHGAGEVSICYEDADALAFMDIQPVNPGHVLVVPRQHHESLVDTPPELAMHLFQVSTQLANVIRKVTNCDDMNIVVLGETAKRCELLAGRQRRHRRRKWSGREYESADRSGAANVPTECRHESV